MKLIIKTEDLKTTSTEQLHLEVKTIKVASVTLGIMLLILLSLAIFVNINNTKMISLLVVPFALSPILFVFAKRKLIVKEEIKKREI